MKTLKRVAKLSFSSYEIGINRNMMIRAFLASIKVNYKKKKEKEKEKDSVKAQLAHTNALSLVLPSSSKSIQIPIDKKTSPGNPPSISFPPHKR